MKYILIILLIFVIAISRAYYLDYISNKEEFKFSIRNVGKKIIEYLLLLIFVFGIKSVYENFIPLNKNHGIEFNSDREKLGIPKLGENWENRKYQSDQFSTYWWNPETRDDHFKKIIEYGILNVETETDYYKNKKRKETFAWSLYNFKTNTFEYSIEKPNNKNVSVTESGSLKMEKPTTVQKISKLEFEKYITQ